MIIREWRAQASRSHSAMYPEHFRAVVIPELKGIPGFLGASLSQCQRGNHVEFVVLTRWATMDAVRQFAGASPENAVVDQRAVAALTAYDGVVRHYEVLEWL